MEGTLQTKSLFLKAFDATDIDPLFEIQGNPEWMKYTVTAKSRSECANWLHRYEASRADHGFAPWTLVHKQHRRVVGWGGLNVDPLDQRWGVEVAYFIHPDYSGQGLATELVVEALRSAREELLLKSVGAFVMPGNTGSNRVLGKAGFEFVRYEAELRRNYLEIKFDDS